MEQAWRREKGKLATEEFCSTADELQPHLLGVLVKLATIFPEPIENAIFPTTFAGVFVESVTSPYVLFAYTMGECNVQCKVINATNKPMLIARRRLCEFQGVRPRLSM